MVLSIGCGAGWWEIKSIFEKPSPKIYLLDPNPDVLNWPDIQDGIQYFQKIFQKPFPAEIEIFVQEAKNIPLPNQSLQEIWLLNSLHEINEPEECLKECHRLLSDGGILLIEEELSFTEPLLHEGCNKPLYFLNDLEQLLKANGFQLIKTEQKDEKAVYLTFQKP